MSQLFSKTAREAPRDEVAVNAVLLTRAGFVHKNLAGVYTLLPLALRVMHKIEQIVREEMDAIGGQELLMNAVQNKRIWERTGRWASYQGTMYQFQDPGGQEIGLAPTHEEVIADLATRFIASYRDLPTAVYQFQTKFRHEARARSGLLRGREFRMKDLYSFHATEADLDRYYWEVAGAYQRVFDRIGIPTILTEASGGPFSKEPSHEFQAPAPGGEDIIYYCQGGEFARNREVFRGAERCPSGHLITEARAIEVGNIFKLGGRYSEPLGLYFTDPQGQRGPVLMASYGIGITRLIGTCVELFHDAPGIRWPAAVAPYHVSLITVGSATRITEAAEGLDRDMRNSGIEVLYDDRDVPAGEKFADADLIGSPWRTVVSEQTLQTGRVELKSRSSEEIEFHEFARLPAVLHERYKAIGQSPVNAGRQGGSD